MAYTNQVGSTAFDPRPSSACCSGCAKNPALGDAESAGNILIPGLLIMGGLFWVMAKASKLKHNPARRRRRRRR